RYDPNKRLTMREVLSHDFFNGVIVKDMPIIIKKREKWDITPKVMSVVNKLYLSNEIKKMTLNLISHCLDMKCDIVELSHCCVALSYILRREEIPDKYTKCNLTKLLEHINFCFH